jgi:ankyrin repeat protein
MAALCEDHQVFKRLIDVGVDVNAINSISAYALHIAAQHSTNPKIFQALLDASANANAVDQSKFQGTPLFTATIVGNFPYIKLLVEARANVF